MTPTGFKTRGIPYTAVGANNRSSQDTADERVAGSSTDGAVISNGCRLGSTKDSYKGMRGIRTSYGRVYQDRQLTVNKKKSVIGGVVGGRGSVVPMGFLLSAGRSRENGDSLRGVQTFTAGGIGKSRGCVTGGGWFKGERDIGSSGSSVWVCLSSAIGSCNG